MPNNQFRAFRSRSNTFNQRTYKHHVHPKRRVVFKRNQQSGFKTKIQVSLYLKNWRKTTQSKSVLDIAKRLQDSFCSETNPNLPSANPANRSRRGLTDQHRNLPSVMSQSIPTGYIPPGNPQGLAKKIAQGVRI